MRRLILLLALLAMTLGTGCMQMHMDTDIESDGSGTATVAFSMGREVADALAKLEEMGGGGMGGQESDMPDLDQFDRATVEAACKESGVELKDFQQTDDATGKSVRMEVAFDDVAELSRFLNATTADDGEDTRDELRIEKQDDGNYLLKTVTVDVPASATEEDLAEEDMDAGSMDEGMTNMQESMQYMGVLMSKMNELDVRMTVTVPGEIISSNAMEVEDRTSIWSVNAANMMQAQDVEMEPHIVFSGKGVSID